jgi:hypothetical protein
MALAHLGSGACVKTDHEIEMLMLGNIDLNDVNEV